ncbi:GDSL esterase/lipase 7-like [Silene latifolia]|uniref:GDSL esterase/lipase 7-like n=1 Tax=Silene latifolia TaxID=37657 RepID=UPI003D77DB42
MLQARLKLHLIFIISHFLLAKPNPHTPALYVFGDSLLDNGNNNWLPSAARADYAPYGLNFPSPVLGRFTNGKTPADFLADYLGLPYPPPYASLFGPNNIGLPNPMPNTPLFKPDSFAGYNYASAACGILPLTGINTGKCYSFDEQIEMFRQTKESQLSTVYGDPTKLSQQLSNSIFLISVGSSDYIDNYFVPLSPSSKFHDAPKFAQLLIDRLSLQLKRLYSLGARKLLVTEVPPIGCSPTGVKPTKALMHKGECDEEANNIVSMFNKHLPFLLTNLTSTLQGSHVVLAHIYSTTYDVITNPSKYGLRDSTNPCCRTWFNGGLQCIPEQTPCSNPNEHFFWDGYHPTEAAFSIMATEFLYGSSACSPISLQQLVEL